MAKMRAGRREAFTTERAGGAAGDGAARLGGGRVGGGRAQGGRRDAAHDALGGAAGRRGAGGRRGSASSEGCEGHGVGRAAQRGVRGARRGVRRGVGRAALRGSAGGEGRCRARRAARGTARRAAQRAPRLGGRRGRGVGLAARRGTTIGEGSVGGGAAALIQTTEKVRARDRSFRSFIFVGRDETDENTGRSEVRRPRPTKIGHIFVGLLTDENNFCIVVGRPTKILPGPRKYSRYSSVPKPTKITALFSWAGRRKYPGPRKFMCFL
jgi:hypothetical protein